MERYRIKAMDVDRFVVERYWYSVDNHTGGIFDFFKPKTYTEMWTECMDYVKPKNVSKRLAYITGPRPAVFKTEKEAEAFIAEQIKRDKRNEKREEERQNFIDAHPTREVPPFKHFDV